MHSVLSTNTACAATVTRHLLVQVQLMWSHRGFSSLFSFLGMISPLYCKSTICRNQCWGRGPGKSCSKAYWVQWNQTIYFCLLAVMIPPPPSFFFFFGTGDCNRGMAISLKTKYRPAQYYSGLLWKTIRWGRCLVMHPQNNLLASKNFCLMNFQE